MLVDHDAPEPPYLQVAAIMRERIQSGQLPPGSRVPSITDLMHEFGIAATPRAAPSRC